MKIKQLKEIFDDYDENTNFILEYVGQDIEIEKGDSFRVKNIYYDEYNIVAEFC